MERTSRRQRITWTLGCVLIIALLGLAIRELDLGRLALELTRIHTPWLAAATLCYGALIPLWALQWHILSPSGARNTLSRMLGVVAVTSTTLNTTVLLVGEATGVVLLVTRIGLDRAAALSVLAMDQLLVGIAKLAVLTTAASLLTLPDWMEHGILALSVGVIALLIGTLFAAWHADTVATRLAGVIPPRLLASLRSAGHSLAPLRSPSRASATLLLALAKKLVEVLAIMCVQRAFGIALPLGASILILAALGIATMLPLSPGNVGVYEGVVTLVYIRFGVPPERAVGMALVQHASYLAAVAVPGLAVMGVAGRQSRLSADSSQ